MASNYPEYSDGGQSFRGAFSGGRVQRPNSRHHRGRGSHAHELSDTWNDRPPSATEGAASHSGRRGRGGHRDHSRMNQVLQPFGDSYHQQNQSPTPSLPADRQQQSRSDRMPKKDGTRGSHPTQTVERDRHQHQHFANNNMDPVGRSFHPPPQAQQRPSQRGGNRPRGPRRQNPAHVPPPAFGGDRISGFVEHQPFENIGHEFYRNDRPAIPSRTPYETAHRNGGLQDVRYQQSATDERRRVDYRRDENNGPRDRSGRRDETIGAVREPPQNVRLTAYRAYEPLDWRSETHKREKGFVSRYQHHDKAVVADTATQRERLTTQLSSGTYECMVCCESVKPVQPIWSCCQCYHAFHLGCIKKWSRTSQNESGQWRCPGCQSTNETLPSAYLCFCNKRKDPEWNRREIPHSCGEVCGKSLGDGVSCTHTCTLLCHPGPCPICSAQTQRKCPCGKTSQLVKCGSTDALLCGDPCEKQLSCGLHKCQEPCHVGPCQSCPEVVKQICHCGQTTRELPCSIDNSEEASFHCDLVCRKALDCGHHNCEQTCHPGECGSCQLLVDLVTSCPCGKMKLKKLYQSKSLPERKSCNDPVPVCGQTCGKVLTCGLAENPHTCAVACHAGPCPPCLLTTTLRCRCGKNEKHIPCRKLSEQGEVVCERRCTKKRQCGRHKCTNVCCVDPDHICPLVCGRPLSCGLDRCEALCHPGNCNRCYRVSFDELRCHCGTQVIYPPVPCGTRPPDCTKPCTRMRSCGHPQQHNCHPDATGCPPCVALCEKYCFGKHELRKNVPCHLTEVSCGKLCGKPLKCGRHTCTVNCHTGPCPTTCSQPCPVPRTECSHPCNLPCHEKNCPPTPCREKIKVQCQCGQRNATVSCEENELSYRKMATGLLASKMAQLQSGESVELKDLLGNSAANKTKSLECNEECVLVERNRRLALALQIKNPNPKPGPPPYPESLKNWAKKDPQFAQMVHDELTRLVERAKQSVGTWKSRQHSFDSMNFDKRQFIHDYCPFFGCESQSYDDEPKRNVVATAFGELSYLPTVGIVDVIRKEMGIAKKMPAPPRTGGLTVLTSGSLQHQAGQVQPAPPPPANAWGAKSNGPPFRTLSEVVKSNPPAPPKASESAAPSTSARSSEPKPPVVDYFDFTS